jgi:hypothetical protein
VTLRRALIVAMAAVAASVALPASASAITIGSHNVRVPSSTGHVCDGFLEGCAFIQTSLTVGTTKAPGDGRITSWKVMVSDPGGLQLVIARKRDAGGFRVVGESRPENVMTTGVLRFPTNRKVKKGDMIGINFLDEHVGIRTQDTEGAKTQFFGSAFALGDITQPGMISDFDELQLSANFKPKKR